MPAKDDHLGPLCPVHYERMVIGGESEDLERGVSMIESHGCKCTANGCLQMYSVSMGYFTTKLNEDYWSTTGSPSLAVIRNATQVICGAHKCAMFMDEFNGATKLARFRCPHDGKHMMDVQTGGAPAYWLSEGYFESPMEDS